MIWGSIFWVISWMSMGIQVMTWAGLLTLVGLFASACAHHTSPSAQNLNEPPPSRESSANAAQIKADLTAARENQERAAAMQKAPR
jgi:hypothetical protein